MKNLIAFCFAVTMSAQATIISWNYDNNGTVTGSNVAGIAPAANWTNSYPANPKNDLIDKDGQTTTLDINYTSTSGGWAILSNHPGVDGDGTYNKELMNGYLNSGGVNSSSVMLSQIPYAHYHMIVYFSSDVAGRNGTVTLAGGPTYDFTSIGPATRSGVNALLTQTSSTNSSYPAANYAVFTGLAGSSQTVSVNIPQFGGIAGIQIVADLGTVPEFGLQPGDLQAEIGSSVTLSSSAPADPSPTYQWEYSPNGSTGWGSLQGETSETLNFGYILLSDKGYYRVVATNSNGSTTSNTAFLDVSYGQPNIITQPAATSIQEGASLDLSVVASGLGSLTYQWYGPSGPINGATEDTLHLINIQEAGEGGYYVKITDDAAVSEGLPVTVKDSDTAFVTVYPAWSGLVSHEPFNTGAGYVVGELPAQNPVVAGYIGAWMDIDFGDAEPAVAAGSLSYGNPQYPASSGDMVTIQTNVTGGEVTSANSGRVYRLLDAPLQVNGFTAGTRYLSFLFKSGQETGATGYQMMALYNTNTADENRNFDIGLTNNGGESGTSYDFGVDGVYGSTGVTADTNVHLMVVKFDLSASPASDNVTVWVDPAPGGVDPAGGVTVSSVDLTWDRLSFSDYDGNSAAWDEIRWGSTYGSVTFSAAPTNTYASWIAGYPGVGLLAGFNDDADKDGISNGLENYFGTNPSVANTGITQISKIGSTVTFQHPQNVTPAGDLTAAYRWSVDLVNWNTGSSSSGGTTAGFSSSPNTPSPGMTTVTATITGAVPARFFTKLEVRKTP